LILMNKVTKIYDDDPTGNTEVMGVNEITLHIEEGEFTFIVGSSGSGKSTFMKLLLKEIDPTSGEIYINSRSMTNLTPKEIPYLRRQIGVVFQDFRLLKDKTIFENVAFAMRIVGESRREIRRKVPAILAMVGLQKKAHSYPHQLSGGEQQRTAMARALINNPPILLADEPTGNLDPDTAWEIMGLLEEINNSGTTVIVATHAKDIVDLMKKRVITIKDGEIYRDVKRGGYSDEI